MIISEVDGFGQTETAFSSSSDPFCWVLKKIGPDGADPQAYTRFRLVKRRRALLESIPSRNSQLETHPNGEQGRRRFRRRLDRLDRFPNAS